MVFYHYGIVLKRLLKNLSIISTVSTWNTTCCHNQGQNTNPYTHDEWGQCGRSKFASSLPHAAWQWLSLPWAFSICWKTHSPHQFWLPAPFCLSFVFQHKSLTWLARFFSKCFVLPTPRQKLSANCILFSFSEKKLTKVVLKDVVLFLAKLDQGKGISRNKRKECLVSHGW